MGDVSDLGKMEMSQDDSAPLAVLDEAPRFFLFADSEVSQTRVGKLQSGAVCFQCRTLTSMLFTDVALIESKTTGSSSHSVEECFASVSIFDLKLGSRAK